MVLTVLWGCFPANVNAQANACGQKTDPLQAMTTSDFMSEEQVGMDSLDSKINEISLNCQGIERQNKVIELLSEECQSINAAGGEAFFVNADTFDTVQNELNTDLKALNIERDGTYLVSVRAASSVSKGQYTYRYNGKTYTLREVMVTASDNKSYEKTEKCNLLSTTSRELINNMLNTAITAYLDAVCKPFGTVASICGLDVSKMANGYPCTFIMFGGVCWTRYYTQVYQSGNGWVNGACTEKANTLVHFGGTYYDSKSNTMRSVPTNETSRNVYSQYFYNTEWKNRNAVIYSLNSMCKYDVTGPVRFKYGDKVKITLREDF